MWKPLRLADAEHSHWDWSLKTGRLAIPGARIMSVECGGVVEGMAFVFDRGHTVRLNADPGQPLVYVDIIEAAPWNLTRANPSVRYYGVGPVLLRGAIELSRHLGYGGRVGLHSLEQAERFYRRIQMHEFGPDPAYYGLVYFEFTAARAVRFLEEAGT